MRTTQKRSIVYLTMGVLVALFAAFTSIADAGDKIELCHVTSSDPNDTVIIDVSTNAYDTHISHGDYPSDLNGCGGGGGDPIPTSN